MSLFEFLERLEADPFDPELTALFLGTPKEAEAQQEERTEE